MVSKIEVNVYDILKQFIPSERISAKEPMANHTSFKIGGPADIYVQPASGKELVQIINECRHNKTPFFVLGHGTNILVPDEGLRKVVIHLYPHFSGCQLTEDGTHLIAEAGALLSAIANMACKAGLKGLEFASGIPGTVGGAICMNAGAYGHDISDICVSVDMLMPDGEIVTLPGKEMAFGYRTSILQQNNGVVLSAKFALSTGNKDAILAYMQDLNGRRRDTQPLDFPSAGSTYKRPPGHYAGKLISDCNLKGVSIGGAQVSEKHAGFIINTGNATAKDVLELMEHVQDTVKTRYGVMLEPEVKILCNL